MIDKVSKKRAELLHPFIRKDVEDSIKYLNENVLTGPAKVRITSGLRTFEDQEKLYNQGRTTPGKIITNAKPGFSFHNYGLAFDFCLIIDGKTASWNMTKDYSGSGTSDWMEVVEYFKRKRYNWGGDFKSFKDYPHIQMDYGITIKVFLERYKKKDFIDIENYVKI
jgi:peptidoglycan L-alanyl-D-glutamate endopeptidase CwlK